MSTSRPESPAPPPPPYPDPTTQMAWPMTSNGTANDAPVAGPSDGTLPPEVRYRAPPPQKGVPPQRDARPAVSAPQPSEIGRKRLTTLQLFNLSISMAGAQVAWTVELG